MDKQRLSSLSDGIIAIIITIMLLKIDTPHGDDFSALYDKLPLFFSYVLSYLYIGIYWNNHHLLFSLIQKVSTKILWLNLHLLFWLTMIPLTTDWMASSSYASVPMACYAFILLMCSLAYLWLEQAILVADDIPANIANMLKKDYRLLLSILAYIVSVGLSFISTQLALLILLALATAWFLPNRKVEYHLNGVNRNKHRLEEFR